MKAYEMIRWFQQEFPYFVEEYKLANHHFDQWNLNPFHLEGDCWSHLCMAMAMAEAFGVGEDVRWALLIHDLGKPRIEYRNPDNKRVAYKGHDGLSFWMGEDVLRRARLPEDQRQRVLSIVNLHSEFARMIKPNEKGELSKKFFTRYKYNVQLALNLVDHCLCDGSGRLCDAEKDSYPIFDIRENMKEFIQKLVPGPAPEVSKVNEIIILSGLPCSGKSTWVKDNSEDYVVLSRDQLVEDKAKADGISYDKAWKKYRKKLDGEFNRLLKAAIAERKNIIVDKTHTSPKSRGRSLGQIPDDYRKVCKVFVAGMDTLMKRENERSTDGKSIPYNYYVHLATCFKIPTYEQFDEIDWIFT